MAFLLPKDLPRYECFLAAAKDFPELDPSASETFLYLLRAGDQVAGLAERYLHEHEISPGCFGVLMLLWRLGLADADEPHPCAHGRWTPAALAEAAGVARATMTGLIDTLERDKLVRRVPDPTDRRMMSVRLTPQANRFLKKLLPGHFHMMASLLSTLNEPERKTLVRLLAKVSAQADTIASPAMPGTGRGFRVS